MQKTAFVLLQLDEARRYIKDGRLQHLRLALLLLDNAVEIQMDRRIQDDLIHDDLMEKLRNHALAIPETRRDRHLQELVDWTPLTRAQKARIDRVFDEKVNYMTAHGHFDNRLAIPLRHLHRYRNEAYHRARVRIETIRTAVLVLLEISCQMMLTISPGRSLDSGDDYSWLQERFGSDAWSFMTGDVLPPIIDAIRSDVLTSDESVASTLAAHLESRFAELDESLDFIVESVGRISDHAGAVKESQYFAAVRATHGTFSEQDAEAFVPTYSLGRIQDLRERIPLVSSAPTRLDAFQQFSIIEKELEPMEQPINDLTAEIDAGIQLAIDIARGK